MNNTHKWVTFAGAVLVVVVLYLAQAVLVPFAVAVLLTFVLNSPTRWLQQWVGRVPAVLMVVVLVFATLGLAGWGLSQQMENLAEDLPGYRSNIRSKVADVRQAGKNSAAGELQKTIEAIGVDLKAGAEKGTAGRPLVVTGEGVAGLSAFAWLGPIVGPLSTAGLVAAMVVFMLLEHKGLRDRLILLFGYGHLATTTRAMDEAGSRVSRQLLMQSLVSLLYGIAVFAGLYFLDVPYPLVWAILGALLRFVPYAGPLIAAAAPTLVAFAALQGWSGPLSVLAFFIALELITNLALETVLYAGAAGVSQVALLVSIAFWTWLWGPLGLLIASPLTVCVVVLGKHTPGLEFVGMLMDDSPALAPAHVYYQRLLARDQSEAAELIDSHIRTEAPDSVYDTLLLPALVYAERDRLERRLSPEEELGIVEATRELVADAAESIRRSDARKLTAAAADRAPEELPERARTTPPDPLSDASTAPLRVLGYAVNGLADEVALSMLARLIDELPIVMEITATRMQAAELVSLVETQRFAAVFFVDLPPSTSSKTRYLVRRLRSARPDVHIAAGRWAPSELADESRAPLTAAGADHIASVLLESRDYLARIAGVPMASAEGETLAGT